METNLGKALAICAINRKINSLLVSGGAGIGKSLQIRKYMELWKLAVMELPLHISDDMFHERLDVEKTLQAGSKVYETSFLERAAEKFVYVDDINLLRPNALKGLTFSLQESTRLGVGFTVIGSMNPNGGIFSTGDLESFDMFIGLEGPDLSKRIAILEATLQGKVDLPLVYTLEELDAARERLALIKPSVAMMTLAASYCVQAGVGGNQVDSILLEVACALAALDGKDYVLPCHMEEATLYVLPHRMNRRDEETPPLPEQNESAEENQENSDEQTSQEQNENDMETSQEENNQEEDHRSDDTKDNSDENNHDDNDDSDSDDSESDSERGGILPEQVADISRDLLGMKFDMPKKADRFKRKGSGKRMLTRTDQLQGRYIRSEIPKGKIEDLALDATIRAAAPYQKYREKGKLAVAIRKSDWRSKVREKRIGRTFLFVVDASGSMGAKKRMEAVKGAIYALLQDAYEKRDKVGLIAFRREAAELLLPFTRSIELARRYLEQLPTGGKTPLAKGLEVAYAQLRGLFLREPHEAPVLVLVTDGRATYDENGCNPVESAREWAKTLSELPVDSVVLDTEKEFISLGIAKLLAKDLGARYYPITDISRDTVIQAVHTMRE